MILGVARSCHGYRNVRRFGLHTSSRGRDDREADGRSRLEPNEIFELIIKADEKVKYAKPGKGDVRAAQARELLEQARIEALAIDNEALVAQAERRLADVEALENQEDPG